MYEIQRQYLKETKESGRLKNPKPYGIIAFNKYLEETGINLYRLKVKDAQNFQSWLLTCLNEEGKIKYAGSTVAMIITDLKNFYNWLKKKKKVHSNPFLQIKRVRKKKKLPEEIPDEEKIFTLLNHLKEYWNNDTVLRKRQIYRTHVVCELMYSTGLPILEVMGLKTSDIDFDKGLIYSKGKKYLLNDFTKQVLKIYVEKMRAILLSGANHRKQGDLSLLFGSKNNLLKWLNQILARESETLKLGIFSSKYFRHALTLHLLKNRADIRFIQEILGYKSLHSIQMYIRMDKENLKAMIDEFHPRNINREIL